VATLKADPGAADANSYLTRTRANEILLMRLFVTAWTEATDPFKDTALMMATMVLDSEKEWLGTATFDGQALVFPRTGLKRRNGQLVDPNTIPTEIEYATAELAHYLLKADPTAISSAAAKGITELQAGPVKLKFKEDFQLSIVPLNVLRYIPPSWYVNEDNTAPYALIESV
jgi:hypothetical protein